jgi:hypothetical protein
MTSSAPQETVTLDLIQKWASAVQAAMGCSIDLQFFRKEDVYGVNLRASNGAMIDFSCLPVPPLDQGECSEVLRQAFLDASISLSLQSDSSAQGPWQPAMPQSWQFSSFASNLWHNDKPGLAPVISQVQALRRQVETSQITNASFVRSFSADSLWQRHNDHGWAALAVKSGQIDSLRAIIDAGMDLNIPFAGRTALDWSLQQKAPIFTLSLLAAGANPEASSPAEPDGPTLLYQATRTRPELVDAFLSAGASPSRSFGIFGRFPLHEAKSADVVSALIAAGANVNARDDFGQSALHEACARADVAVVMALVSAGADLNQENAQHALPCELIPPTADALFEKLEALRVNHREPTLDLSASAPLPSRSESGRFGP